MKPHIRSGDTVFHDPSGETWVVAFVEGDRLSPCGWPPTMASVADCELLQSCTDAKHREMLETWAIKGGEDFRTVACQHQLLELNRGHVGAGI